MSGALSDPPDDPQSRLAAARAGDLSALNELCDYAQPLIERKARSMMGEALRGRYRTSDFVQSAMLEAVTSLGDFRGRDESEFVQWILRILENNVRDRVRNLAAAKRSLSKEETLDMSSLLTMAKSPVENAETRECLLRVAAAMTHLPKDQQRVLHLVVLRGLSHEDAAMQMSRSEMACRALLARARANLLIQIQRHPDNRSE